MIAIRPDVVLFDVGGVLVRLSGVGELQALAGIASADEVGARWLSCPWVRRYERGLCTSDEFAAGVVTEWELPIDAATFLERFRAWPDALYDGALELVGDVRATGRVGCLSNTNELHWGDQCSRFDLAASFDAVFVSHELGLVKPDRELFEHVTEALAVAPERVLFLDDNLINVHQARSAGWSAVQVRGVDEARGALLAAGVL